MPTVTLADLRTRPACVSRLAKRPRGVRVLDTDGRLAFVLRIPMTRLR